MLSEEELKKYIGRKIKEYRNKSKITQEELGVKLGVKHNTVSAYERGAASPDSDTLFRISSILGVNVDDLFPPLNSNTQNNDGNFTIRENNNFPYLSNYQELITSDLGPKDMRFLQRLIEKTLSLEEAEREKFLDSIRFTVEFYDRKND